MNLILFESAEIAAGLPRRDPRAVHLIEVLRRRIGDTFDAGLIDGPQGKGTIDAIDENALSLTFSWGPMPPPLDPITLIIGLPRPQTARDILRETTALGVAQLHFVVTEKGEPNYAQSTLWFSGEWRRQIISGAEQAFTTRLPTVAHSKTLDEALATLSPTETRIALDNYESPAPLGRCHLMDDKPVVLAIGSERGWSARERERLREQRFAFAHLGPRVLRTETAVVAAIAIVRAKLGLM